MVDVDLEWSLPPAGNLARNCRYARWMRLAAAARGEGVDEGAAEPEALGEAVDDAEPAVLR